MKTSKKPERILNSDNISQNFITGFIGLFENIYNRIFATSYDPDGSFKETLNLLNFLLLFYFLKDEYHLVPDKFFKGISTCHTDRLIDLRSFLSSATAQLEQQLCVSLSAFFDKPDSLASLKAGEFSAAFKFFDSYTYSLKNSSSVNNQETITPDKAGKIYEQLVSFSTGSEGRSLAGVFYTQTVEVEFICRLVLSDYLISHCGKDSEDLICKLLSSSTILSFEELRTNEAFYRSAYDLLMGVKILDPACGSGVFLVLMLNILEETLLKISGVVNENISQFNLRRKLISENLYGVDILEWSCCSCQLQLFMVLLSCENKEDKKLYFSITDFKNNIRHADSLLLALKSTSKTPIEDKLTWPGLFPEIFSKDQSGFDLVIGNPPYVRQENISAPLKCPGSSSIISKKDYKQAIIQNIYDNFPWFFGQKSVHCSINAKSDLYLYFYFAGLSVLKRKGSLCYITSNSWLDVDFGIALQEFLLRNCHLKLIIDNNTSRSFEAADVNTVISLISEPNPKTDTGLKNVAGFISLNVSFEEALSQAIFSKLLSEKAVENDPDFKKLYVLQQELYQKGCQSHNFQQKEETGNKYSGNKLGGRYLRAPDIYNIILKKAQERIVPLGKLAEVRFGIKSGANNFFYLDDQTILHHHIEPEFIKPFLFSLKEVNKYQVEKKNLKRSLFVCHQAKEELKKASKVGALNYIEWGERQKYNLRPSVQHRNLWYSLKPQATTHFVSNRFLGERFGFPYIEDIPVCDVFFAGRFKEIDPLVGLALINSTFSYLSVEVLARKTYGIGVAYLYGPELCNVEMLNDSLLADEEKKAIKDIFAKMRKRQLFKLEDELRMADRQQLDRIIFDTLQISQIERDCLYESILHMVKMRLQKAGSFYSTKKS